MGARLYTVPIPKQTEGKNMTAIKYTNQAKAAAQIAEVQKLARVRTIGEEQIAEAIALAEKELSKRMFKKDWEGVKVSVDFFAGKFPASYKGRPESTVVKLLRGKTNWQVAVIREYTDTKELRICYPESSAAAMLAFARAQA